MQIISCQVSQLVLVLQNAPLLPTVATTPRYPPGPLLLQALPPDRWGALAQKTTMSVH